MKAEVATIPTKSPWTAVTGEDGQVYYWNEGTNETAWEKPVGFVEDADAGLTEEQKKQRTEKVTKLQSISRGRKARKEAAAAKLKKQEDERAALEKEREALRAHEKVRVRGLCLRRPCACCRC